MTCRYFQESDFPVAGKFPGVHMLLLGDSTISGAIPGSILGKLIAENHIQPHEARYGKMGFLYYTNKLILVVRPEATISYSRSDRKAQNPNTVRSHLFFGY